MSQLIVNWSLTTVSYRLLYLFVENENIDDDGNKV